MPTRDEAGVAALEVIVAVPLLLAILAFLLAGARLSTARGDAQAIAREAAREAVEEPDAESAFRAAQQVAREVALDGGLDPARLEIEQDSHGFQPGGTYVVEARYVVLLSDLPGLGLLPGSVTVGARHLEPIDPYRSFPQEGRR